MKKSEQFALGQWLSWYADSMTYDEIIALMRDPDNSWTCDDLDVWVVVENFPLNDVAEFIEDTKRAFEASINEGEAENE